MNEVISTSESPLKGIITGLWKLCTCLFWAVLFPVFILFIFGYLIKLSDAYTCVMHIVEQDPQVIAEIGEPVTPGFFAWTTTYEGGLSYGRGHFYTAVSGPRGRGRIEAAFESDPIYNMFLRIQFKGAGEERELYRGAYECP